MTSNGPYNDTTLPPNKLPASSSLINQPVKNVTPVHSQSSLFDLSGELKTSTGVKENLQKSGTEKDKILQGDNAQNNDVIKSVAEKEKILRSENAQKHDPVRIVAEKERLLPRGENVKTTCNGANEQVGNDVLAVGDVPHCDTGRKGSFMITRVIAKDVPEDLDDTANTEDASSVLDISRLTDQMVTEIPSSTDTLHTPDEEVQWPSSPHVSMVANQMLSPSDVHDDAHSRFRIVKIESRDRWHRGRWTCHDFADPPVQHNMTQSSGIGDCSIASAIVPAGAPIYYIPGVHDNCKSPFGIVYCETGVPVLEPSLLASPLYTRNLQFFADSCVAPIDNLITTRVSQKNDDHHRQTDETSLEELHLSSNFTSSPAVRQLFTNETSNSAFRPLTASSSETAVDKLPTQLQLFDSQQIGNLQSVGSATNLVSMGNVLSRTNSQMLPLDAMMSATLNLSANNESNGCGAVAIDNKIEQAMDLVKSHLMFAVREEVDLLKEQIKQLIERNEQLKNENSFLRSHATPETLALLNVNVNLSPQ